MKQPQNAWIRAFAFGSTIATSIACLVGGGYFLGSYIDTRFSTGPWMKLILMVVGLILGGVYLISSLKKMSEDKEG